MNHAQGEFAWRLPARFRVSVMKIEQFVAMPRPRDVAHRPLTAEILRECEAMARYCLHKGLAVPPESIAQLSALQPTAPEPQAQANPRTLALLHQKLARAVAPATPQAIVLLDPDYVASQRFTWLGPVPLIRALTLTAVGFLAAVVLTGLSSEVSTQNIAQDILNASGATLLVNLLFLLFCAGLGAAFGTLFHAHRYIANSTYDPKYDASYCARLILGMIAGLILVEMLPAQLFEGSAMSGFGRPTLAMLGGFSGTAVHRLLQRIVDTMEALLAGDPSSRIEHTLNAQRTQAANERTRTQSEIAAQLLTLQQSLDAGTSPEALRQRLGALSQALLSPLQGDIPDTHH